MKTSQGEINIKTLAKFAGAMYLLQMAAAVFAQLYARGSLLVRGEAVQTAQNILASESLFRLSIVSDIVAYLAVLLATWALYVMLRPISHNLAILALVFRLLELAIHFNASTHSIAALRFIETGEKLPDQAALLQLLGALSISVQGGAVNMGFILLGLGSSVFALLLYWSRLIPRTLAGMGVGASLLLALYALATIQFPALRSLQYLPMLPMGFYEVALGLWLLVKGVQHSRSEQSVHRDELSRQYSKESRIVS